MKEIDRDNTEMADAMKHIFDMSSNLHQHLFQSEENISAQNDPSLADKLSVEERAWRKSLVKGSKIDAIKLDNEYNLKIWAKAEVSSITGDIFQVVFENDIRSNSIRYIHWYSPEIDRYNTNSEGDDWRLDLKVGDFIDAFDSTKVWY